MVNSLIFLGSTHGSFDDFSKQKEVIESVNPEFVLCEELEDLSLESKESFNELFRKKEVSNMTSFDEIEKLAKLCFDKNINLIGIDFHNFGFDSNLQKKIKNQEEPSKEEEIKLDEIIKSRELNHLKKILEYQEKTNKPLVVIIGCWHLRDGSLLREKLKDYKAILPCDENGNQIFASDGVKEIKYKEVSPNGPKNKN